MKRHFTQEDTQITSKHKKPCSTSLATRKVQMKINMRDHYTPIRTAVITTNAGRLPRNGSTHNAGGNVKRYSTLENSFCVSIKLSMRLL